MLTGELEPTNEWYAIAKIAGIKLCQAYRRQYGFNAISAMPTNLYGPVDNFHPENSHVLPALLRRFHAAKAANAPRVVVWGTGAPRREFLYVDDLAEALLFLMQNYSEAEHINVGRGADLSILELARLVAKSVNYAGKITTDPAKPDGAPQKLLDVSRLGPPWAGKAAPRLKTVWPKLTPGIATGLSHNQVWLRNQIAAIGWVIDEKILSP